MASQYLAGIAQKDAEAVPWGVYTGFFTLQDVNTIFQPRHRSKRNYLIISNLAEISVDILF